MDVNEIQKAVRMAKAYGATRLILFGSALETPAQARDLDLACDGIAGWKLYEFAARLEEELNLLVDLVPLTPASRFTRWIETQGQLLYEG